MADELSSASIEFSGEGAVEQAIAVLQKFAEDEQFDKVNITLTNSQENDVKQTQQSIHEILPDDSGQTSQQENISSGTSHHKVLTAMAQPHLDAEVPVTDVINELDLPDGTVYAAMSTLHERGLVTREKGSNGNYQYTVTDFGRSELERIGRADV